MDAVTSSLAHSLPSSIAKKVEDDDVLFFLLARTVAVFLLSPIMTA